MNPQNNALQRTYFIGGPPRVGKGILANQLARQINGHVASTDAIRNAVKKAVKDSESDLFIVNKNEELPEFEWLSQHLNEPQEVVNIQNTESKFLWPSVVGFCNAFCEDNEAHILEGVGILPNLVANMQNQPKTVIFIGNTDEKHWVQMLKFARDNPEWDWMHAINYSDAKIEAMGAFVKEMSMYFRSEAKKYNFRYYELKDKKFNQNIQSIINDIINT